MNTGSIFWGWPNDAPGTPGGDESGRRKREGRPVGGPTAPAIKQELPEVPEALAVLSVPQHRFGFLGVLLTDDDLCGHGAYGINGRHIFVADHRPDACAVEHRFGYLGFGDGVVFR